MKKVLQNSEKTRKFLDSLPRIYLVGFWAHYGVWEFPFSGKYKTVYVDNLRTTIDIPLVYQYDDQNGTCDNYYLRRIDYTTTGGIIMWTQFKSTANKTAELYEKNYNDIHKLGNKENKNEE